MTFLDATSLIENKNNIEEEVRVLELVIGEIKSRTCKYERLNCIAGMQIKSEFVIQMLESQLDDYKSQLSELSKLTDAMDLIATSYNK